MALTRLCPHCDNHSNFDRVSSSGSVFWGKSEQKALVHAVIFTCQVCQGIIVVFDKQDSRDMWEEFLVFPSSVPSVSEFVNTRAAADYVSAVNCLSISEFKAAATMLRRSLQQIMLDKGAVGDKLHKQIDDLAKRNIITEEIRKWAHEIRFWGNDGAHPPEDYLDEITEDEISEAKEFLERIFDYVYIMPGKLEAARKRREDKKNNTDS